MNGATVFGVLAAAKPLSMPVIAEAFHLGGMEHILPRIREHVVRSLVAVGALVSYCKPLHTVSALQPRSLVALGASVWYCSAVHCECDAHSRLDDAVGATLSYSPLVQSARF